MYSKSASLVCRPISIIATYLLVTTILLGAAPGMVSASIKDASYSGSEGKTNPHIKKSIKLALAREAAKFESGIRPAPKSELVFYPDTLLRPVEIGPEKISTGQECDHSKKLGDSRNELERQLDKSKKDYDRDQTALAFFVQNNEEGRKADPVLYHFHMIRLGRKLIAAGALVSQAELAKALREKNDLESDKRPVPASLTQKIAFFSKQLANQRSNYDRVENLWLEKQDAGNVILYVKLKRKLEGGVRPSI